MPVVVAVGGRLLGVVGASASGRAWRPPVGVPGAAVLAPLRWGDKRYCRCASAGTGMVECVEDGDAAPQPSSAGVAACAERLVAVAACGADVDDSLAGCGCGC